MKKTISAFSAIVLLFSMLPFMALNVSAAKNYHKDDDIDSRYSMLWDDAGIFSEENFEFLNDNIQQYAEELEMNICIYVSGSVRSDYSTEIFADDTYDEMYGEDIDGIFYYLDLSGKRPAYDYISTSGKAVLMYQKHVDDIFSYLDNYLPSSGSEVYESDIYSAVNAFLAILDTYADENPTFFDYYHDKSSGKYFYYKDGELIITKSKPPVLMMIIGAASVLIGLIIALIVYFSTKSGYKFKSATNPSVYVARNESMFTQKSDMLIRTYVTKTKIESSSGGGGGGGHSHSGGHGGGGHHR